MILTVKWVFTAATLFFAFGYHQRRRNNARHRMWMLLGFLSTLLIAVVLVAGVHLFGETYSAAPWLVSAAGSPAGAKTVIIVHRIFSTLAMVGVIVQVVSGMRRLPLHKRFHRWVIPMWLVSYFSGLVVFV